MDQGRSLRPWRGAVALLAAVAMLAGGAVPADAAVPRFRIPRVYDLPEPRFPVPNPPLTGLDDFSTSFRYGVIDEPTVDMLDDAGRGLRDDIELTAAEVRANAEARRAFKDCTGDGLEGAGTSYAEALDEAAAANTPTPAPDFDQVISGTSACLQTYFPDAPDEVFDMGEYLAGLAAERAQEAYAASQSGAVLAEWMTTTGVELPDAEDEASGGGGIVKEDPPTEPDGGFPVWAAIAVLVALAGGATYFKWKT